MLIAGSPCATMRIKAPHKHEKILPVNTRKLGDGFGLEVDRLDLAQIDSTRFAELERTFYDCQVMVLSAQRLSAAQFLAFARRLGRPQPHVIDQFHHPEFPDILILSNVVKEGKPMGLADAGTYWHTDYSYLADPAKATTLYSIQVPKAGGDTLFANQRAAYDDLPEATKRRIDGLVTRNIYGNRDDRDDASRTAASPLNEEQWTKMSHVKHPLVRKHPVSGRKALYAVSGTSIGIDGMPDDEALDLLNELKTHSTQSKYQLRVGYGVGDVVIWDNPSLLHSATLTDPNDARTLWRITIKERAATHL
jgi:taurine dioxygenase